MSESHQLQGPYGTALVVRFLLELALLAGAAVAAWQLADGWWSPVAAIGAVVCIATVWGLLLSPKAPYAPHPVVQVLIEAVLFVVVGVGLVLAGHAVVATIGVALWAADRGAMALFKPR